MKLNTNASITLAFVQYFLKLSSAILWELFCIACYCPPVAFIAIANFLYYGQHEHILALVDLIIDFVLCVADVSQVAHCLPLSSN